MNLVAPIGILMLDTRFERIVGDVGHPASFAFPVLYRIVAGASARRVVLERAEGLLGPFIDAARALQAEGVAGISTTCGFLAGFQDELCDALEVPVLTSSLLQVGLVQRCLPAARRVGILTIARAGLTPALLAAAGVPSDTPIGATDPDGAFNAAILGDAPLDVAAARREHVAAAERLLAEHPEVGAIVLECTNMPPYAAAIAQATGVPVFSVIDLICWFQAGLRPARAG
ncbi:MAG: aspartate/glutamate racemase family protein [Burkholderiaceae bacterium]